MSPPKVKVELGAGIGKFRDRFLPGALTTDLKAAEGIDLLADAMKLPFKPESVDEFVANNPYGFGVKSLEEGIEFLSGVRTVLKSGGRIVIRAHSKNPYAKEHRIRQVASQLGLSAEVRKVDTKADFPGHIFLTTRGDPAFPNFEFVISKGEESNEE